MMSEARGVEAAAQALRVDEVELPGVLRWLGRRRRGVRAAVLALVTAMPGRLGTVAEVGAVRSVLGTERALVALREIGADHLHALGPPLGFGPPCVRSRQSGGGVQHETGPDPPGAVGVDLLAPPLERRRRRTPMIDDQTREQDRAVSLRPDRRSAAPGGRASGSSQRRCARRRRRTTRSRALGVAA